jgi:tetratricopeptide (TPR) repeat protein
MTASFTTREVAKIVELPESRVRACVRAGLIFPARDAGHRLRFSFHDLLLLRTSKGLFDSRVPLPRVRRMLSSLKRQLPDAQRLTSLTIYADGRRVVAWDGTARWQPDSGQFLFNFEVEAVVEQATMVEAAVAEAPTTRTPSERSTRRKPTLTAEQWFDLGCELDASSPEEARRAYEQALALDPQLADAHVNLGRLYHAAKQPAKAEAHYRAAIREAPEDAVPHFNLAVLLEEFARPREAVRAYRDAIRRDPDFGDAHYNLGLVLETLGERSDAIAHLRLARKLSGRSTRR